MEDDQENEVMFCCFAAFFFINVRESCLRSIFRLFLCVADVCLCHLSIFHLFYDSLALIILYSIALCFMFELLLKNISFLLFFLLPYTDGAVALTSQLCLICVYLQSLWIRFDTVD